MMRLATGLGLLALFFSIGRTSAAEPVQVSFSGLDGQGRKPPTMLTGQLFEPDEAGLQAAGALPAVIMLHGCKGMMVGEHLRALDAFWAEHWRAQGYAALLVDSYTPRGIASLCRTEEKDRPISTARDRVRDAYAALRWLVARREIDPSRVALIGWASGGGTVLSAVRPVLRDAFAPYGRGFRTAIAFYPGNCRVLHQLGGWVPYAPILILMGEIDDWTPPEPCEALVADAAAHHADVSIRLYPGAYHDFDSPSAVLRERPTGTAKGSAHSGTDAPARDAAIETATDFLRRQFAP
jgi:dienelactone hydrolase